MHPSIPGAVLLATIVGSISCSEKRAPTSVPVVAIGLVLGAIPVGNEPYILEVGASRVAVTMMGLGAVLLHDFDSGRTDTVGRGGGGPGEFARAGQVVEWGVDRFAVLDPVLRRATVFRIAGVVDTLVPFPVSHATEAAIPHVSEVWVSPGGAPVRDSVPLLRLAATSSPPDTLGLLGEPPRRFLPLGNVGLNLSAEYAARDIWGILPDGRVCIARGEDNRVDWIGPHSALARGVPRAFPVIRTVAADRQLLDGLPAPKILDSVERDMAAIKAPFQDVRAGPKGDLWFWMNQPAGYATELYSVLASDGSERIRVTLPGAHKIIAVSRTYLYVLGEDASGEWVITRHQKPSGAQ